jgi:hypothetical protein
MEHKFYCYEFGTQHKIMDNVLRSTHENDSEIVIQNTTKNNSNNSHAQDTTEIQTNVFLNGIHVSLV